MKMKANILLRFETPEQRQKAIEFIHNHKKGEGTRTVTLALGNAEVVGAGKRHARLDVEWADLTILTEATLQDDFNEIDWLSHEEGMSNA